MANMSLEQVTENYYDVLKEIGNIGAGNAMTALSQMLQCKVDMKVPQVKFVDRTFNCDHEHTMKIWKYINEHDNGITNFHFELSAELLTDEEIDYVSGLRPGLVQFEIGTESCKD